MNKAEGGGRTNMKLFFIFSSSFIGLILLGFVVNYSDYLQMRYFAPRVAAIDSSVFHESAQYNDGMVRDLENLRIQYKQTHEDSEKLALKAIILHRFSIYPKEKLSPDLRNFYDEISN